MFILKKLLGDSYQAKILEVLIENFDEEFTIPEIIEIAETSRGSTYSYIDALVKEGIVFETRKIGRTQLYQLNMENPATKPLILLEHDLVLSELEKEIPEKAGPVSTGYDLAIPEHKRKYNFHDIYISKYENAYDLYNQFLSGIKEEEAEKSIIGELVDSKEDKIIDHIILAKPADWTTEKKIEDRSKWLKRKKVQR